MDVKLRSGMVTIKGITSDGGGYEALVQTAAAVALALGTCVQMQAIG